MPLQTTFRYFLGCDVSKRKLDIALTDANGILLWFDKVANEEEVLATFLLTLTGHYPDAHVTGVVEAIGVYHQAFTETCYAVGMPCRVYNPIITKSGIRDTIRGKKTDQTDALLIAHMGLCGEGRLYTPEPFLLAKS